MARHPLSLLHRLRPAAPGSTSPVRRRLTTLLSVRLPPARPSRDPFPVPLYWARPLAAAPSARRRLPPRRECPPAPRRAGRRLLSAASQGVSRRGELLLSVLSRAVLEALMGLSRGLFRPGGPRWGRRATPRWALGDLARSVRHQVRPGRAGPPRTSRLSGAFRAVPGPGRPTARKAPPSGRPLPGAPSRALIRAAPPRPDPPPTRPDRPSPAPRRAGPSSPALLPADPPAPGLLPASLHIGDLPPAGLPTPGQLLVGLLTPGPVLVGPLTRGLVPVGPLTRGLVPAGLTPILVPAGPLTPGLLLAGLTPGLVPAGLPILRLALANPAFRSQRPVWQEPVARPSPGPLRGEQPFRGRPPAGPSTRGRRPTGLPSPGLPLAGPAPGDLPPAGLPLPGLVSPGPGRPPQDPRPSDREPRGLSTGAARLLERVLPSDRCPPGRPDSLPDLPGPARADRCGERFPCRHRPARCRRHRTTARTRGHALLTDGRRRERAAPPTTRRAPPRATDPGCRPTRPVCGPPPGTRPVCGPPPGTRPVCGPPPRTRPVCGPPPRTRPVCGPPPGTRPRRVGRPRRPAPGRWAAPARPRAPAHRGSSAKVAPAAMHRPIPACRRTAPATRLPTRTIPHRESPPAPSA
ncbi:hypothetical protein SAMN05421541_103461 [Actinoplanes philippinensis]|uniref:Uncharacterized protein n=1 Tax=Actinoplanes philippinensis TaxID=35752 RepID=A0A1I2D8R2_9ACTN|nr:hypothetical protein SAMN05421541_103461 [Actinoplanes philippinensis]